MRWPKSDLEEWIEGEVKYQLMLYLIHEYLYGHKEALARLQEHKRMSIEEAKEALALIKKHFEQQLLPFSAGGKFSGYLNNSHLSFYAFTRYEETPVVVIMTIGTPRVARNLYLFAVYPGRPSKIWRSVSEHILFLEEVAEETRQFILQEGSLWFLHSLLENYGIKQHHALIETKNQVFASFDEPENQWLKEYDAH